VITVSAGERLVEAERSGFVESIHCGHLIIIDPSGAVVAAVGDPDRPIFARSCMKPLQVVGLLRMGLPPDPADIALAAGSHSGSPRHLQLIADSLAADGLTEADLACPVDFPLGEAERRASLRAGDPPRRLAMNCSGKHAAMLRTCLRNSWSIADYLAPSHPLQRRLAEVVAELSGEPVAHIGVDGCGAPIFAISPIGLARAFARLCAATGGPERQVTEAMRAHPDLVAGEGRAATRLMRSTPGLVAKDGAEGCFAAALADGGAVAVKISDGAARAAEAAVAAALRRLGVAGAELDALEFQPLYGAGAIVGHIRAI
jgi:L-asparaginase II